MHPVVQSAGGAVQATSSASPTKESLPVLPLRAANISIRSLVDLYMAHYAGRDSTRAQRLAWWSSQIGHLELQSVTDDDIHIALEVLATRRSRHFAGVDADGKKIFKAKHQPLAPATLNRYGASISAVFTWAIKRRIAPKGWDHPCRRIERRPEHNEKTRFLTESEREKLLTACRQSKWPRLYLLVLVALTTGARKSEILNLQWAHVDFENRVATLGRTKNGDPRLLPLTMVVIEELRSSIQTGNTLVFASKRRPTQPYAFEARFAEALKVAGIRNFRFHDLRHSCASLLAQRGASLLEISDILGHRQIQVTKRYAHLTTGHKANIIDRVMGEIQ